jgi:hypothetical protein
MAKANFDDEPPTGTTVTDYDRSHLALYLRLLDAADDGANWREAAATIFGLDSSADYARTKKVYDAHLARAQWLSANGYRDLVRRRRP